MKTNHENGRSRTAKLGWGILLGLSALLVFAGINWYVSLSQMTLENISDRTSLEPDGFMTGDPSAFDVITLVGRGYGTGYTALGLFAALVALEGYRKHSRWAWKAMWVLAVLFIVIAINFTLAAGELYAPSFGGLVLAALALIGLLLARRGLPG